MTAKTMFIVCTAATMLAAQASAQNTSVTREAAGAATHSQTKVTGVVVQVDGNSLLAKMPDGSHRLFNVAPGRQFIIDGQPKTIAELKPGTTLTATVTTMTQPVTVRTATITGGTVLFQSGNFVSVKLQSGEIKGYNVPDGFKFTVDGRQVGVEELRQGMKVTATRVVAEPQNDFTTETVVTGTAPK